MWRSRILGVWIMPAEGLICIVLRKMNNKREKSDEQRETEDRNRPRKTPGTENPLFKSTFLPPPTLRAFKTAASSLSHWIIVPESGRCPWVTALWAFDNKQLFAPIPLCRIIIRLLSTNKHFRSSEEHFVLEVFPWDLLYRRASVALTWRNSECWCATVCCTVAWNGFVQVCTWRSVRTEILI